MIRSLATSSHHISCFKHHLFFTGCNNRPTSPSYLGVRGQGKVTNTIEAVRVLLDKASYKYILVAVVSKKGMVSQYNIIKKDQKTSNEYKT